MSDPCELTFRRVLVAGQTDVVCIEARDGPKVLARIDITPADFAVALVGEETVTAAIEVRTP